MNLWCRCICRHVEGLSTTTLPAKQAGHAANWSSDNISIDKGWCHWTGKKPNTLLFHVGWELPWKSYYLLMSFSRTRSFYKFLNTFLFSAVPCGENLFMSTAPFSWSDAIQAWYNEEKDFEYGTGAKTRGAVIGHYTQVDATFIHLPSHHV